MRPVMAGALLISLASSAVAQERGRRAQWEPVGLSGGGAMFAPAVSPTDPKLMLVACDMGAAYRSEDGGRTWTMIHHAQLRANTRCRPAFHPAAKGVVFAASGYEGRLRVSRDGARTFTEVGDLPGDLRGEVFIDRATPALMLVGCGEEVWRSVDGGLRWRRCDGPRGEALAFCSGRPRARGARLVFAATREGVWRSADDGQTWEEASRGLPSRDLRGFAGGFDGKQAVLYCTVPCRVADGRLAGGIYRSTDAGTTWEPAMGEGLNLDIARADEWAAGDVVQYHQVLTTDARPATVYAFNANTGIQPPHHATVYRSDDAGRSWRPTFQADPRFPGCNVERDYTVAGDGQHYQAVPWGVAGCASDPDVVVRVDSGTLHVTRDGGRAWSTGHSREARAPGTFTCTGLVVTSTWNYDIDPTAPNVHTICYTDIGLARSEDAGRTWRWWAKDEHGPWKNTTYELARDPTVRGKVWGAFSDVHDIPNANIISGRHRADGAGGVCVSVDSGVRWTRCAGGLPVAPCTSVVVDPSSRPGRRRLWAGFFGHGVYRSQDDGATWSAVDEGLGAPTNKRVTRVALHRDGTLFALVTALRAGDRWQPDGVGLYRSTDGGDRWACITTSRPFLWPKDFTVDPADSRVIYLGAADAGRDQQGGLHRTRDGGATWTRLAREGPEHFGAYLSPHHEGLIYMTLCEGAPGPGLWASRDDGATWAPFDDLPFSNIQRVALDPAQKDVIYVTTFGGGVWRGPALPRPE